MSEEQKVVPIIRKVLTKNFRCDVAGVVHNIWSARMEEADTLEDALNQGYWSPVADKVFNPGREYRGAGDIIHLRNHDNTLFAELFIRVADKAWLKTGMMRKHDFGAQKKEPDDVPLTAKWNVGSRRYDVVRRGDNKEVVQAGFALKEDAFRWIADHLKAMAA